LGLRNERRGVGHHMVGESAMSDIELAIFGLACGLGVGLMQCAFAAIIWNKPNAALVAIPLSSGLIGIAAMMAIQ
jgi:hypothetical protein